MSAITSGICTMNVDGVNRPVNANVILNHQTSQKEPLFGLSGYQGYAEVPTPATAQVSSRELGGEGNAFIRQLHELGTNGRRDNVSFTFANGDQHQLQNAHLQGSASLNAADGSVDFVLFGERIEVIS